MFKNLRSSQQQAKSIKVAMDSIAFLAFIAVLMICMYPEVSLATGSLEAQLDKVGGIANGKFKTIGLTAATIGGSIWSVVKGNLKLTGIIIVIGICMSLYLEWIAGGMRLTTR